MDRRKVGRPRKHTTPTVVKAQRYTDTELKLIESVAEGEVGAFIHDAAVDRARLFADAQEG